MITKKTLIIFSNGRMSFNSFNKFKLSKSKKKILNYDFAWLSKKKKMTKFHQQISAHSHFYKKKYIK